MKNFICKKCYMLVKQAKNPTAFGCSSGGHHQWQDMGEIGDSNYQCKKCSQLLQSKKIPSAFACSSGGHHQWQKM